MKAKAAQGTVMAVVVVAIVVLFNILSSTIFTRLDLTGDQRFTLTDATRAVLSRVQDPVTIKAYFTEKLPYPQSSVYDYTRDLLDEYHSASGGTVRFEFIDPMADEDDEDRETRKQIMTDMFGRQVRQKTKMETELEMLGIPPIKIRVSEDNKLELRRAYMGLDIRYGEKNEVIPVVQDMGKLEYMITTMVRKMTRPKTPHLALVTGHGGPSFNEGLAKFHALLSEQYQLVPLDLSQKSEVPKETDLLLVVGPQSSFTETEKKAIDKHIAVGKSVAFLLDPFKVDMRSFSHEMVNHGLDDLLAHYGVTVEPGLVGDVECASFQIQRRVAFLIVPEPVKYPYMPLIAQWPDASPITHDLGPVPFPFPSPIRYTPPAGTALKQTVLAHSSPKSWKELGQDNGMDPQAPVNIDLNPLQDWSQRTIKPEGPITMAMTLAGVFPQAYPDNKPEMPAKARVAVFGTSMFAQDQFLDASNIALLMNTFDWLLADDELLAMRSRGLAVAPLDKDISPATMTGLQAANIIGPPVLLILFGLLRWQLRTGRRRRLQAATQQPSAAA